MSLRYDLSYLHHDSAREVSKRSQWSRVLLYTASSGSHVVRSPSIHFSYSFQSLSLSVALRPFHTAPAWVVQCDSMTTIPVSSILVNGFSAEDHLSITGMLYPESDMQPLRFSSRTTHGAESTNASFRFTFTGMVARASFSLFSSVHADSLCKRQARP